MESGLRETIDNEIRRAENGLYDEISRVQNCFEKQMREMKEDMREIKNYYRIHSLEENHIVLLVKEMENFRERLDAVERKVYI